MAVMICATVVILSIFFGSYNSIRELRQDVELLYYGNTAAEDDANSIVYLTSELLRYGANMVKIAEKYGDKVGDELAGVKSVREQLLNTEQINRKIKLTKTYVNEIYTLYDAFSRIDMDENERRFAAGYHAEVISLDRKVVNSGYNTIARGYNAEISGIPANMLSGLYGMPAFVMYE